MSCIRWMRSLHHWDRKKYTASPVGGGFTRKNDLGPLQMHAWRFSVDTATERVGAHSKPDNDTNVALFLGNHDFPVVVLRVWGLAVGSMKRNYLVVSGSCPQILALARSLRTTIIGDVWDSGGHPPWTPHRKKRPASAGRFRLGGRLVLQDPRSSQVHGPIEPG